MSRLDSIDHFVVLMLENRSFDNILGALHAQSPGFDGLALTESNLDRKGVEVKIQKAEGGTIDGLSYPSPDPGEHWKDLNRQIFGPGQIGPDDNSTPIPGAVPDMSGFVNSYTDPEGAPPRGRYKPDQIMRFYEPDRDVHALATLAREFAVCDCWFASAPCQTWPNRLFLHTGGAGGYENNTFKAVPFDLPTVFGRFFGAPGAPSWRIYHHDLAQAFTLSELVAHPHHFRLFDDFRDNVRSGDIANYTFIEPRYYSDINLWPPQINLPNDQHPPHIVTFADQLVAEVYNALRANEDVWKKTMLVIIYDEHGGIYDHRPPGPAVPPGPVPGERDNQHQWPFKFDRFGVRVPAIIASPFVKKGTVLRPSDSYPNDGATPFDHTSVIATLQKRFQLGEPLTARVAAAPTLERVLAYDTPENMGPEVISSAECKVSLWYKIKSLFELWSDFQSGLHEVARRMPAAAPTPASTPIPAPTPTPPPAPMLAPTQKFVERHSTPASLDHKETVAHSDIGAIVENARYRVMRLIGMRR